MNKAKLVIRASAAMAVCEGEKYIEEQIDSILGMMSQNDELIISYDESQDNTLKIIKAYEKNDLRIRVVYDKGKSVESNFNNAVQYCRGNYIFLADQDDVWINDKINVMVQKFEEDPEIVVLISNGWITDAEKKKIIDIYSERHTSVSPLRNFIKGTYLGCQMAFSSKLKELLWPVSVNPPLPHDLWLGVVGAHYGKVVMIPNELLLHRLHNKNYSNSSKMGMVDMVKNRVFFAKEYIRRICAI